MILLFHRLPGSSNYSMMCVPPALTVTPLLVDLVSLLFTSLTVLCLSKPVSAGSVCINMISEHAHVILQFCSVYTPPLYGCV